MSDENVFRIISVHVVRLLQPIRRALASEDDFKAFLFKLGWTATSVPQEYKNLAQAIDGIVHDVEALADDVSPDEVIDLLKNFIPIYKAVAIRPRRREASTRRRSSPKQASTSSP